MSQSSSSSRHTETPWYQLPGGLNTLSQDDRLRIRQGFDIFLQNRSENGARFFSNFFERNPEYKTLFPQLKDIPNDQISKHKFILCVHVDRFFLIFDDFMANIYNSEGLHNAVYGMLHSRSHMDSKISANHIRNMLDALLITVEQVLTENGKFEKADKLAWKKFMSCLLNVVKNELA